MTRKELLSRLRPQIENAIVDCGNNLFVATKRRTEDNLDSLQVIIQGLELLARIDQELLRARIDREFQNLSYRDGEASR